MTVNTVVVDNGLRSSLRAQLDSVQNARVLHCIRPYDLTVTTSLHPTILEVSSDDLVDTLAVNLGFRLVTH